jgi:tRNA pseudouridine65 synthase
LSKTKIIFRSGTFIATSKPEGVSTYGSGPGESGLKELLESEYSERFFPVHRIDRETSGLVLFALNSKAAAELSALFSSRAVKKTYLAWVRGNPPDHANLRAPLQKKGGPPQSAETQMELVKRKKENGVEHALLRAFPKTGRFHQIRRHFEMAGYPIVTEPRLMLHAQKIEWQDPKTKRLIRIECPPPASFWK